MRKLRSVDAYDSSPGTGPSSSSCAFVPKLVLVSMQQITKDARARVEHAGVMFKVRLARERMIQAG